RNLPCACPPDFTTIFHVLYWFPNPDSKGTKKSQLQGQICSTRRAGRRSVCARRPFQKLDSLKSDRFRCTLDVAPDSSRRGELRERESEAFDGQPAVVLDIA